MASRKKNKITVPDTAPGCLTAIRNMFVSNRAGQGSSRSNGSTSSTAGSRNLNEKSQQDFIDNDSTLTPPPTYTSVTGQQTSMATATAAVMAMTEQPLVRGELPSSWEKNDYAKTVQDTIEYHSKELRELSIEIHDHPELGWQEFKAHELLTNYLEDKGFTVTRSAYGLETGFLAVAGNSSKVTIGVCSEYDALPGVGHACGHNLIAISGVATALALKAVIEKFNLQAQVKLFGTPAEETTGGKINMLDAGAFKGVDVCLMLHGANADVVYPAFLALDTVEVEYFGKASHAAASPWEGINALDALMSAYQNIGLMRQQLEPTHRVHGIIQEGGKAANIIPDYTKGVFTVRAPKWEQVVVLKKRVEKIFKAAALATGCTCELKWGVPYKDIVTNDPLAIQFEKRMNEMGLRYPSKAEQLSKLSGSTDFGNLSYAMPGIHPMFNIQGLEGKDGSAGLHSYEFAKAAKTMVAHAATLRASKALALTGVECIVDSEFLKSVKKDFEAQTGLTMSSLALSP